jgi:3-deoxy-D-manno-octulosonate 8-phosphate phosphatase (KDO 8-P phosphatase)
LRHRARNLELLVLDVDGVLTEGELILIGEEQEAKRFSFHDGLGLMLLRSAGMKIALMSDRQSAALVRRAVELSVDEVAPVVAGDKEASLEALLVKLGLEPDQVGYVGDDLRDVPPMRRVGLPVAVANARPQVKAQSVYVTRSTGGSGAVREVAEWLLELRGQTESVLGPLLKTRSERTAGVDQSQLGTMGPINRSWFIRLVGLFHRARYRESP